MYGVILKNQQVARKVKLRGVWYFVAQKVMKPLTKHILMEFAFG